MIISNKEAALLGLLCEKPMHAYEIEKTVEDRDMRYWTEISMSSIYKVLKKLEDRKYLRSRKEISDENRVLKIYSVTPSGKKAMREKLKQIISKWEKPKRPLDIALSNLYLLNKKEVLDCFEEYVQSIDKMIACYGDLKKYLEEHCSLSNIQLADRPIKMLKAEKRWLKEFLEGYRNEEK